MLLKLIRFQKTDKSTIGRLYVDGRFECYTLEDVIRYKKVDGKTAIPAGNYDIIINQSARFKRLLPLLQNVPNFTGVRIHPGNTAEDTEGCILVGNDYRPNLVTESRKAFNILFEKMQATEDKISIQII